MNKSELSSYFPPAQISYVSGKLDTFSPSTQSRLATLPFRKTNHVLLASIFLGWIGVDRFLIKSFGIGVLKIFTSWLYLIPVVIDWFLIQDRTRKYNLKIFNDFIGQANQSAQSVAPASPQTTTAVPQQNTEGEPSPDLDSDAPVIRMSFRNADLTPEEKEELAKYDKIVPILANAQYMSSEEILKISKVPIESHPDANGYILNPKSKLKVYLNGKKKAVELYRKQLLSIMNTGYDQNHKGGKLLAQLGLISPHYIVYLNAIRKRYNEIFEIKTLELDFNNMGKADQESIHKEILAEMNLELSSLQYFYQAATRFYFKDNNVPVGAYTRLCNEYSPDIMHFVTNWGDNVNGLKNVEKDHYNYGTMKEMVDKGVALHGENIPLEYLLEKLKVNEIREILKEYESDQKFSKKADGIAILLSYPDVFEKVRDLISFRDTYYVMIPEEVLENQEELRKARDWYYSQHDFLDTAIRV